MGKRQHPSGWWIECTTYSNHAFRCMESPGSWYRFPKRIFLLRWLVRWGYRHKLNLLQEKYSTIIRINGSMSDFTGNLQDNPKQGKVTASYKAIKSLQDPQYYSHFTIAKLGAGCQTADFKFRTKRQRRYGMGNSWSALLKTPLNLDEGNYMLVTGTRMANGSVLTNVTFFSVVAGKRRRLILRWGRIRKRYRLSAVLMQKLYRPADSDKEQTILSTTGRGYFVVAILGARQEPTNHAFAWPGPVCKGIWSMGRSMVLLFPTINNWKFRCQGIRYFTQDNHLWSRYRCQDFENACKCYESAKCRYVAYICDCRYILAG